MAETNSPNLRVMIVAKWFPPAVPSKSARAMQMAKVVSAMHEYGLHVEVVAGVDCREKERPVWPFPVHYVPFKEPDRKQGLTGRMISFFGRAIDSCLGRDWVRDATRVSLSRIKAIKADAFLTASNPGESHLVGLRVKHRTEIPWVAFFSDPWPFFTLPVPYRPQTTLYRKIHQMWQGRRIMKQCDAVAMPNKYGILQVEKRIRVRIAHKGYVVGHVGCGTGKQSGGNAPVEQRIIHIGDLTRRLSPALILAVKAVAEESAGKFKGLLCIGNFNSEYEAAIKALGAEKYIQLTGFIPSSEAAQIAASSQALLVIEADMPESPFLPSKFADYAFAGRPILAITPLKSAIRDYLNQYGGGLAVTHSAQEIADALRTLFASSEWVKLNQAPRKSDLATCFSPAVVAEGYCKMFKIVCQRTKKPGSPPIE